MVASSTLLGFKERSDRVVGDEVFERLEGLVKELGFSKIELSHFDPEYRAENNIPRSIVCLVATDDEGYRIETFGNGLSWSVNETAWDRVIEKVAGVNVVLADVLELDLLGHAKVAFRHNLHGVYGTHPDHLVKTWSVGEGKGWQATSVRHSFRRNFSNERLSMTWTAKTGELESHAKARVLSRWEWNPPEGYSLQDWETVVGRGKTILDAAIREVITGEFWVRYGEGP